MTSQNGIVMLHDLFKPSEDIVVYGACIVRSPKAGKYTLLVGSDDGIKIWLNGRLVWEKLVRRPLTPDQDRIEVELKEGDNLLLLKLDQGERRHGLVSTLQRRRGRTDIRIAEVSWRRRFEVSDFDLRVVNHFLLADHPDEAHAE